MSILSSLEELKDFRRKAGQRYPYAPMMSIVLMSIMSGYCQYREIAEFSKAHGHLFQKIFGLKTSTMPSHVTFRTLIQGTNFENLNKLFTHWANSQLSLPTGNWLSIDGKALRSTLTNYHHSYQDFVSIVSLYAQKQGVVLTCESFRNKQTSEIEVVRALLKALSLKNQVITLDALHSTKKR